MPHYCPSLCYLASQAHLPILLLLLQFLPQVLYLQLALFELSLQLARLA